MGVPFASSLSRMVQRGFLLRWLPLPVAAVCLFACSEKRPPEPPQVCGSIPQQTLLARQDVSLTPCFEDPEGEELTLSMRSSDVRVATVALSRSGIRVDAISPGSATITVVATDPGGLTAQLDFFVLVPNRPPEVCATIPQQTMFAGQHALIRPCFDDPDFDELTLSASSSDVAVATVNVLGSAIRIRAISVGSATIAVVATDPDSLTARQQLEVLVQNRRPEAVGSPGPATVAKGDSKEWDLRDYFVDPDGQPLTYSATSASTDIATASVVDATTLIVIGIASGSTMVTATATDPGGLSARHDIVVTVGESVPIG